MLDIFKFCAECENKLTPRFMKVDSLCFNNTKKVMSAFAKERISDAHFAPSSGYGYDDIGRDACDRVFADVFECESAFVRHSIVSGTHALSIGLFGLLRPGDTLYFVTGKPYDTLDGVIGIKPCDGSLCEYGVKYTEAKRFADIEEITHTLKSDPTIKVVAIQRSRGYSDRRTLSSAEIGKICDAVHSVSNAYVFVDNCYGELCEEHEPSFYGADLCVGSLIKNLGGGIAESGGYCAGTNEAVTKASYRLTCPGIGTECGASLGLTKNMLKGLYFAPHVVGQALKSAMLASQMLSELGFDISPLPDDERYDIIQT
ncbi:MAG TPA: methionine gamma-lyase family protein, partial [Bacillota bacterium]|nr:methionine gamma-lyase family protein [Bacillota bacterium]